METKIHFTPGEINKGKANPETYDLALVHNDRIRIVPNAFRQDGELLKTCRRPAMRPESIFQKRIEP